MNGRRKLQVVLVFLGLGALLLYMQWYRNEEVAPTFQSRSASGAREVSHSRQMANTPGLIQARSLTEGVSKEFVVGVTDPWGAPIAEVIKVSAIPTSSQHVPPVVAEVFVEPATLILEQGQVYRLVAEVPDGSIWQSVELEGVDLRQPGITIPLPCRGGRISGVVKREDVGSLAGGAYLEIRVLNSSLEKWSTCAISDSDGRFDQVLLPGEVYVEAVRGGRRGEIGPVIIEKGRWVEGVVIGLKPSPHRRLRGTVVDDSGRAIGGAFVVVSEVISTCLPYRYDILLDEVTRARSREDGEFEAAVPANGIIRIGIYAESYQPVEVIEGPGDGHNGTVEVAVAPAGTLRVLLGRNPGEGTEAPLDLVVERNGCRVMWSEGSRILRAARATGFGENERERKEWVRRIQEEPIWFGERLTIEWGGIVVLDGLEAGEYAVEVILGEQEGRGQGFVAPGASKDVAIRWE